MKIDLKIDPICDHFLIAFYIVFLRILAPLGHPNGLHLGPKINENWIQALPWTPKNPKDAKRDPKGSQKGAKREPKGSQKGAKRRQKGARRRQKGAKREPKGSQKGAKRCHMGAKIEPRTSQEPNGAKDSQNVPKINQNNQTSMSKASP